MASPVSRDWSEVALIKRARRPDLLDPDGVIGKISNNLYHEDGQIAIDRAGGWCIILNPPMPRFLLSFKDGQKLPPPLPEVFSGFYVFCEIVIHEMQGYRVSQILDFLWKGIGQVGKPAY